jgi:hypothetical protein
VHGGEGGVFGGEEEAPVGVVADGVEVGGEGVVVAGGVAEDDYGGDYKQVIRYLHNENQPGIDGYYLGDYNLGLGTHGYNPPTQLPMGQNEINPTHLGTRGDCPGLRRMIRNQVVEKAG